MLALFVAKCKYYFVPYEVETFSKEGRGGAAALAVY